MIYLDNSATTKQYEQVSLKMMDIINNNYGNPSSLHGMGHEAEKAVKEARKQISTSLGVFEKEIFFTSGGTESINTATLGAARRSRRKKIITSKIEHEATLQAFKILEEEGFHSVYIDVDENGIIDFDQLKKEIDDDTGLISIMHVNNEVGSIQPIKKIGQIKKNAIFHVDGVQSFGKIDIEMSGIDALSISGHKLHGPKGIGALYLRDKVKVKPLIVGGGQERGFRSGTENVPAIVGMGVATQLINENKNHDRILEMKKYMLDYINKNIKGVRINSYEEGLPNILNVSFLGTRGEVILHMLEKNKIYGSTGSACSSSRPEKSHVLKAMSRDNREVEGALRFSFGQFNTIEEIKYTCQELLKAVSNFRKLGSFR